MDTLPHNTESNHQIFPYKLPTYWLGIGIFILLVLTVAQLSFQGRIWWCACGHYNLWSSNVNSSHNSQHLADAYSFTHILHGILFYGLFALVFPKLTREWRWLFAIFLECCWEIVENTDMIINRYREATISLDYFGDSIFNSLGDVAACALGFYLASRLKVSWIVAIIILIEFVLLYLIRDNLTLNILMLIHPFEAIKTWQMGS